MERAGNTVRPHIESGPTRAAIGHLHLTRGEAWALAEALDARGTQSGP